jgi:hypothetical protein
MKDEKDLRGRWKKGRVSVVHDEIELPFPYAKVSGKLCRKSTECREDVSSKCCKQTFVELPFSL